MERGQREVSPEEYLYMHLNMCTYDSSSMARLAEIGPLFASLGLRTTPPVEGPKKSEGSPLAPTYEDAVDQMLEPKDSQRNYGGLCPDQGWGDGPI